MLYRHCRSYNQDQALSIVAGPYSLYHDENRALTQWVHVRCGAKIGHAARKGKLRVVKTRLSSPWFVDRSSVRGT